MIKECKVVDYILVDEINALFKISTNLKSEEQIFILSGRLNKENVIIDDYFEVENSITKVSCDHIEIDKKYLYACLKTLNKENRACVILHTHPLQHSNNLKESEYDKCFFQTVTDCWNKIW